MLLILRALFGFAMGGVWGVGASLALESIPPKARGLISGLLQEGYAAGYLVASAVFFFLFDRIGWRGMFMVGVVPALLAVFIRSRCESPAFEAERAQPQPRGPCCMLGLAVALAVAVGPAVAGACFKIPPSPGSTSSTRRWPSPACCFPQALEDGALRRRLDDRLQLLQPRHPGPLSDLPAEGPRVRTPRPTGMLTVIGNVGAISGGLFFGAWSERLGRRRGIVIASLLSLLVIPLWAFPHPAMLAAGAFLMQFMVQGAWGIIPVHLNELSPGHARGAFPGYAYQVGNLLASGNAVWQARLAEAHHDNYGLALAVVAGGGRRGHRGGHLPRARAARGGLARPSAPTSAARYGSAG